MRSIRSLLAVLVAFAASTCAQVGTIQPGTYVTFEAPYVASGYSYNPAVTVLNPFTWGTQQGGVAGVGSPFTPGAPTDPPSPNQFAYIQTNALQVSNMTTTLNNLTIGSTYTVEFAYSTRYDQGTQWATQSQLTIFLGASTLWQSPQNITVAGGWVPVLFTFVANVTSAPFIFQNKALAAIDRSILIDSVSVQPAGFNPNTFAIPFGTVHSFENPSTDGASYGTGLTMQSYYYNPGTSSQQPFIWSTGMGGVSLLGSPFDPPAPTAAPAGRQYAFLQTSPNGALNKRSNYLNSSFSGLTVGTSYVVSFYWSLRNGGSAGHSAGWQSETQLTVRVGNNAVFVSAQNLTAISGWYKNTSSSFVASAATMPLSFNIVSLTDHDHTVLFDAVSLNVTGSSSSSSGPVAALSSSSSAAPTVSSSSAAVVLVSSSASTPSSSSSAAAVSSSARSSSSSAVSSSTVASSSTAAAVSSSAAAAVSSSAAASSSVAAVVTSSSRLSSSSSSPVAVPAASSSSPAVAHVSSSSSVGPITRSSSSTGSDEIIIGDSSRSSSGTRMSSSSVVFTSTSSQVATPDDTALNGAQSLNISGAMMIVCLIGMMMAL